MLKFQMYCKQQQLFFAEKMSGAFAVQELLTIFQQKNITAFDYMSSVRYNKSATNNLIKLTML